MEIFQKYRVPDNFLEEIDSDGHFHNFYRFEVSVHYWMRCKCKLLEKFPQSKIVIQLKVKSYCYLIFFIRHEIRLGTLNTLIILSYFHLKENIGSTENC